MLQALDSNGQTVNVVATPETVRVKLPVTLPSKKVPLNFKQSGDAESGKTYTFSSDNSEVTIYGSKAQLKKIDSLEVPVDISGISKTTDQTVKLTNVQKGLKSVDPNTVKVHVKVSAKNSDATVDTVN
jgi:YbbR domain-containing protein